MKEDLQSAPPPQALGWPGSLFRGTTSISLPGQPSHKVAATSVLLKSTVFANGIKKQAEESVIFPALSVSSVSPAVGTP